MKLAFIRTINADFGLYEINGMSICERVIKSLFKIFDRIYMVSNEETLVIYEDLICKYKLEVIYECDIEEKYTLKDYVLFCDCNVLFFSVGDLFARFEGRRSFYLDGRSKENDNCFVFFRGKCKKRIVDVCNVTKIIDSKTYAYASSAYRCKKNFEYIERGVKIMDVNTTYIGDDVTMGSNVVIYPNCFILGDTHIGDNVIIYPNCVIESSIIFESSIVGPFSNIKKGCQIGANSYIGAFVEVKNSCLKDGVKAKHHAYLGDVDIGENCNIGCGVIFANYDGKIKHRSNVGDNVFLGSNTTIVSPVNIGFNSLIAAGSTIVCDVEKESLAIARNKQINKVDYYKDKRIGN